MARSAQDDQGHALAAPAQTDGERPRPNPPSDPPAGLGGVVRDLADAPVADAWVCAWQTGDDGPHTAGHSPSCIVTGRDGSYQLDALPPGRHLVCAGAGGFEPATASVALRSGERGSVPALSLRRGGLEVRGVVRDVHGYPVAGAWVTDFGAGPEGLGAAAATTRSGPDGRFSLWLRPGFRGLFARAEGFTEGFADNVGRARELQIVLAPESSLVGQVVAVDTGAPLRGARVTILREAGASGDGLRAVATTDGDGNFTVDGLFPGSYRASAVVEGGASETDVHVVVGLDERREVPVLEVHPRASLRAVVAEPGGATTCTQGQVYLQPVAARPALVAGISPDGDVLFPALAPGSYGVSVYCRGMISAREYPRVVIASSPLDGVLWEVHGGRTIRGTVVDGEGRPVTGVTVAASRSPGEGSAPEVHLGDETGSAGRFEITGLVGGRHELSLVGVLPLADERVVAVPAEHDLDGLELVIRTGGSIRGRVVDPQGRPLSGAFIRVTRDGTRVGRTTRSNHAGDFVVLGLAPGDHSVWALPRPGSAGRVRPPPREPLVAVRASDETEVRLVLAGTQGSLRGRVLREDGTPLAGVLVAAYRERDGDDPRRLLGWGSGELPAITDAAGRFVLGDRLDGPYDLVALRPGGGTAEATVASLATEVVLTLAASDAPVRQLDARRSRAPEARER